MFSLTGIETEQACLQGKNINTLSQREAMGLSQQVKFHQMADLGSVYQRLVQHSTTQLLEIMTDASRAFKERYVAGNLLAVIGDPRISTLKPEMIVIQGTTVQLGLPKEQVTAVVDSYHQYGVLPEWIEKETPTYSVTLDTFALGRYCVTNWEYFCFLSESGYHELPSSWVFGCYPHQRANYPVYTVSEQAAQAYTEWLSQKTERQFHIPTEAQWEYAAAGGDRREFPWGETFIADRCNSVESGIIDATPVGIFPLGAGPFGHLDLAGNVEEYTSDDYRPYHTGPMVEDDLWLSQGEVYRVARGGSFTRFRDLCRTRRRHGRYNSDLYVMGFRLAEKLVN